jgi:hypothetical protein
LAEAPRLNFVRPVRSRQIAAGFFFPDKNPVLV